MTTHTTDALKRLADVVDARMADFKAGKADPNVSYIAKLFSKGDDAILKKIGEEAAETVMAAKDSRFHDLDPMTEDEKQKEKKRIGFC